MLGRAIDRLEADINIRYHRSFNLFENVDYQPNKKSKKLGVKLKIAKSINSKLSSIMDELINNRCLPISHRKNLNISFEGEEVA